MYINSNSSCILVHLYKKNLNKFTSETGIKFKTVQMHFKIYLKMHVKMRNDTFLFSFDVLNLWHN